jgi:hypothetical protein
MCIGNEAEPAPADDPLPEPEPALELLLIDDGGSVDYVRSVKIMKKKNKKKKRKGDALED